MESPENMDDSDFIPSVEDMGQDETVYKTPKKTSKSGKGASKKKDAEFDAKKSVAIEIAKYKNLYEIEDPKYYDKVLEATCWKKVAKNTGLSKEMCVKHWSSLKRSAKYHVRETKLPYKSGASADDEAVQKKYKEDWPFAEVMAFYTPPSLKKQEKLVSLYNRPSTSKASETENFTMDESSVDTVISETTESVYVCKITKMISMQLIHSSININ